MLIAVLNQSQHLSSNLDKVALMTEAIAEQLRRHAAPAWGRVPWGCALYQDQRLVPPSACRIWLLDSPDVANALGYHDLDPTGHPYGKVFVEPILQAGGDLYGTSTSVSVTLSHESLEAFGDPLVNMWAQGPDPDYLEAMEFCDAVEGDSYPMVVGTTTVQVSNFLYPEWFTGNNYPGARFDRLGKLSAPGTMTAGGYLIRMKAGAVAQQFGAAFPSWKLPLKAFAGSRTARRAA